MMMKKIMIGFGVVLSTLAAGCADWVNVSPKEQVEADDLFSTEKGFKSALIGIYTRMVQPETYGRDLTFGYVEQLAQRYDNYADVLAPTDRERAEIYRYKDNATAKENVKNVWNNQFTTIANVNALLTRLDKEGREVVLTENYWELMKGEALGLRAFLYFDLLRLFGPVYAEDPEMKCLPWREKFDKEQLPLLPASKIAENILADLAEAERLLAADALNYDKETLENTFIGERRHRMNRMAVKALAARVHLWVGNKELAAQKAKEVVDSCGFGLCSNNTVDVSMYGETLFALGMDDMEERLKGYWKDITKYSNELYISSTNAETVFERNNGGTNDIRYRSGYGFIHGENGFLCRKYLGKDNLYMEKVPLIRLAEMYYILAEALPVAEAVPYVNKVMAARGIPTGYQVREGCSQSELVAALNKEYQKEFFAEGQWFYFLKRHNIKQFYRCPVGEMVYYVLPTPDDEIEYSK